MLSGTQNIMARHEFIVLIVTLVSCSAIRVDFNTNKGPIVPPVTTQRPVPKQPYRNPAPVWELQADDAINPNPYLYVLPPPSRPKPATDNYARAPVSVKEAYEQKPPNYGQIITKFYNDNYNGITTVPTLAVQYVPNVGFKYNAVIPSAPKTQYVKGNDYYYDKYNKLNGKYNPKTKKYKAFEKVKYHQNVFAPIPLKRETLPQFQPVQSFTNLPISTTLPTSTTHQRYILQEGNTDFKQHYSPNTFKSSKTSQR